VNLIMHRFRRWVTPMDTYSDAFALNVRRDDTLAREKAKLRPSRTSDTRSGVGCTVTLAWCTTANSQTRAIEMDNGEWKIFLEQTGNNGLRTVAR
jgi:hypothetical protein